MSRPLKSSLPWRWAAHLVWERPLWAENGSSWCLWLHSFGPTGDSRSQVREWASVAHKGCPSTQSLGMTVGLLSLSVGKTGLLAILVSHQVTVLGGVIMLYLSVSKSIFDTLLARANLFQFALQQLLKWPSITQFSTWGLPRSLGRWWNSQQDFWWLQL